MADLPASERPCAVSLREAARRLGFAYITARQKMVAGTFPIPALPRQGREPWRFSERDIDRYLDSAATADARTA